AGHDTGQPVLEADANLLAQLLEGGELHGHGADGIDRLVHRAAADGHAGPAIAPRGAMAVQLPALKKLGEEVGISLEDGLAGVVAGATALGDATPPRSNGADDKNER
ncbi:MAG: hypothetical protein AAFV96_18050, partial [Pseudomonadota bacterium]